MVSPTDPTSRAKRAREESSYEEEPLAKVQRTESHGLFTRIPDLQKRIVEYLCPKDLEASALTCKEVQPVARTLLFNKLSELCNMYWNEILTMPQKESVLHIGREEGLFTFPVTAIVEERLTFQSLEIAQDFHEVAKDIFCQSIKRLAADVAYEALFFANMEFDDEIDIPFPLVQAGKQLASIAREMLFFTPQDLRRLKKTRSYVEFVFFATTIYEHSLILPAMRGLEIEMKAVGQQMHAHFETLQAHGSYDLSSLEGFLEPYQPILEDIIKRYAEHCDRCLILPNLQSLPPVLAHFTNANQISLSTAHDISALIRLTDNPNHSLEEIEFVINEQNTSPGCMQKNGQCKRIYWEPPTIPSMQAEALIRNITANNTVRTLIGHMNVVTLPEILDAPDDHRLDITCTCYTLPPETRFQRILQTSDKKSDAVITLFLHLLPAPLQQYLAEKLYDQACAASTENPFPSASDCLDILCTDIIERPGSSHAFLLITAQATALAQDAGVTPFEASSRDQKMQWVTSALYRSLTGRSAHLIASSWSDAFFGVFPENHSNEQYLLTPFRINTNQLSAFEIFKERFAVIKFQRMIAGDETESELWPQIAPLLVELNDEPLSSAWGENHLRQFITIQKTLIEMFKNCTPIESYTNTRESTLEAFSRRLHALIKECPSLHIALSKLSAECSALSGENSRETPRKLVELLRAATPN